jgi:hypothetical protein
VFAPKGDCAAKSTTASGVQADSSVALLVRVVVMAIELAFRTSVLVDVGRYWWTFDGPETAQTAQGRPRTIFKQRPSVWLVRHPVAQASLGRAAPGLGRWSALRTNDLPNPGAVWLPPVCGGSRSQAGHPGAARVQGRSSGRRRPYPGRRAGGPTRRRLSC